MLNMVIIEVVKRREKVEYGQHRWAEIPKDGVTLDSQTNFLLIIRMCRFDFVLPFNKLIQI